MQGSLYVVDALNYLYRAFHALPPLTTKAGAPTGAVYGLCQMLLRLEREQRPSHVCVVFDAPGATFRNEIFPDYKAHRPPMPDDLARQIELTHRVVEAFGLPVLSVPGVEADDVIATLARQATAAGIEVVICSSDKDLAQLVGDRVSIWDAMKGRRLGPAEIEEKWGVPPARVADLLALTGDSVDNVPGVPGVGPKTAADLIKRFGSLAGVIEHAGEVPGKRGEALRAGLDKLALARRLVALRDDVPLPKSLGALARVEPDPDKLTALFRELEFGRLLARDPGRNAARPPAEAARAPSTASRTPPPVVIPPPAAPLLDLAGAADLIVDRPALEAWVVRARAAGSVGLALLADGDDAMRAVPIGIGLALPDGARAYVPFGHRGLGMASTLSERDALAVLGPLLADAAVAKHVHDAKFIDVVLARHGHTLAGVAADAMLAAYLLDAGRSDHALPIVAAAENLRGAMSRADWLGAGKAARAPGDVDPAAAAPPLGVEAAAALVLSSRQGARLQAAGLDRLYRTLELPLAAVLARLEQAGVRLDVERLRALGVEVGRQIAAMESEIHGLAHGAFNIASPKQLADVLFGKLALPVVRRTKTGASTDADVLEELAALHPVPAKILEYRTLTKLKGTYIDALPALLHPRTGRLHTTFHQAVAATGRLSSANPNLQNIPIRTELGRRIRQAFIAEPGCRIVAADYSQIELRVLAHFSQDPAFLAAFRAGEDIHQRTAAQIFELPPEKITSRERRIAKAINFGLVFGQTDFGLARTLGIPRAQARAYIDGYFARYAGVRAFMDDVVASARRTGAVSTLFGRRRAIPDLDSRNANLRAHAERIARNTPIQGTAADLLKLAMIRVDADLGRFRGARMLLTVHDELLFEVREDEVEPFAAWVKTCMESVHGLRVPLVVDVGHGPDWGAAH